jgi:hypothetical protein
LIKACTAPKRLLMPRMASRGVQRVVAMSL